MLRTSKPVQTHGLPAAVVRSNLREPMRRAVGHWPDHQKWRLLLPAMQSNVNLHIAKH